MFIKMMPPYVISHENQLQHLSEPLIFMLDVFRTADHAGQIFIPHRHCPSKSELCEESTLLSLQSKLWEDSLFLSALNYATDYKSCITYCQLAGCLTIDFPSVIF